jgi:parallel beta-helix repeat protein/predicted outer membrane repeat protein
MKKSLMTLLLATITLTLIAGCGKTEKNYITVTEPALVADFSATPTSGTAPLTVQFTDTSTNSPTSWEWDFDNDGTTDSTVQNPSYIYTTSGTYTVKLTAINSGGSDDEIKVGYITTVNPPAPVADFTGAPTSGTVPLTVNFTDTSTGTVTSWSWDFDNDGTADSTVENPSYIYANAGTYTVKLTVTGPGGSHTETKTDYIRAYTVIYVDGGRPDDTGDGLTWATAKKLIQSGIDAASDSWLVLVANGTYTGTGNKNLDFLGKAIHLKSVGGAENCIIDCENSGRGFYFHSGETKDAVVEGFTIQNGSVGTDECGGGVVCGYSSSPTFTNCTISGNSANDDGGGVCCYWYSSATFTNCTISGNTAGWDSGGVYCGFSFAVITHCTISNNTTTGAGGGIYCGYGSVTITNCTITENSASQGGGIYCYDSRPSITNCEIANNNGSGIVCYESSPTISNCTVTDNTGSGIDCTMGASPTLRNTIIWNNGQSEIVAGAGSTVVLNYCAYQDDIGGPGAVIPIPFDSCINSDPLFVDAAGRDYHLQAGSPCIDAGDNSLVPAGITTDLDGNPRIYPEGGTVDIGAYEYQP